MQANVGAGGKVTQIPIVLRRFADLPAKVGTFVNFLTSGGGVSKAEIVTGKPHITISSLTNYSYTVRTGP
jgi:hypothetical protein